MNTYENAVPKPLKFLVSDGKLVDDAGNVIAESETLKDLYTKWNPEVKKYLISDGSVVDEEGNLIVKNDYYKKVYDQADPKVAKYLHADGTIDENPGSGGGADLEDNHQTTIDVSTYTEPVEVVPESGKDGMKKNTVTLDNIPSGGSATAYAWIIVSEGRQSKAYLNIDISPSVASIGDIKKLTGSVTGGLVVANVMCEGDSYTRISDTEFTVSCEDSGEIVTDTYMRNTQIDNLHIWG